MHGCWGQCVNTAFSRPGLNCRNHVLYVGHAAPPAVPCLMCHLCAGHLARASCPNALHAVDGLQASAWSLQGFSCQTFGGPIILHTFVLQASSQLHEPHLLRWLYGSPWMCHPVELHHSFWPCKSSLHAHVLCIGDGSSKLAGGP